MIDASVSAYMAEIGAKGGSAGKGDAKRKRIARRAARASWSPEARAKRLAKLDPFKHSRYVVGMQPVIDVAKAGERTQVQAELKVIESRLSDGSTVHGVSIASWGEEIVLDCASEKQAIILCGELDAAIAKAEGRA
jgi:hypothetical protein